MTNKVMISVIGVVAIASIGLNAYLYSAHQHDHSQVQQYQGQLQRWELSQKINEGYSQFYRDSNAFLTAMGKLSTAANNDNQDLLQTPYDKLHADEISLQSAVDEYSQWPNKNQSFLDTASKLNAQTKQLDADFEQVVQTWADYVDGGGNTSKINSDYNSLDELDTALAQTTP